MTRSITQAVVLCGGKGTRLGALAGLVPKPMVGVGGVALLDRTLALLAEHGVESVLLLAGHLAGVIERHYALPRAGLPRVVVVVEEVPMGTAGALWLVASRLQESFLLVYGDIFLDLDVGELLAAHAADLDVPLATLTVRASDHPWDSHLVVADELGRVSEFVSERVPGRLYRNLANAALYVCGRELLGFIPQGCASDFGKDVFPACLAAGARLKTWLLPEDDFVKDMGTPDRLAAVECYLDRKGRALAARAAPRRVRAVLLDRDGTLNVECGLISEVGLLELLPGAGAAVARLGAAGLGCHVVTNQPVIARGLCSVPGLEAIHARLRVLLAECGAVVGMIRYCPHHPETHHVGGVPELRRACDCRKPNAGLLWQVVDELGLDPAEVVMVGDREVDVRAGVRAGMRTILLGADGGAPRAGAVDVVLPDLAAAADFILSCWC